LPSPSECLPSQPGPVYLALFSQGGLPGFPGYRAPLVGFLSLQRMWRKESALPGFTSPGTFRSQGFYPLSGLLLPAPLGLVSSRNAPGIRPSEPSLPKEPLRLSAPLPSCRYRHAPSMAGAPELLARASSLRAVRLQGFALSRSPFSSIWGLATSTAGALLGFSSSGISLSPQRRPSSEALLSWSCSRLLSGGVPPGSPPD